MTMIPFHLPTLKERAGYWYLATPYSKYPAGLEAAYQEACRAAAWLIRSGVRVFSPIAHTHGVAIHGDLDPLDHKIWLPADRPLMDDACGLIVAMLEGWAESYGIQQEILEFTAAQKPIMAMEWGPERTFRIAG